MALPEIDPSRRFKPRSRGELNHPGACAVCGSGDPERTYLDLDIYDDYVGNRYLCDLCFRECVQVMGFFSPEEVADLLSRSEALLADNTEMKKELDDARPILNAVRNVLGTPDNVSIVGVPSDTVTTAITEAGTAEQSEVTELLDSKGSTDSSRSESRNRSKPVIV